MDSPGDLAGLERQRPGGGPVVGVRRCRAVGCREVHGDRLAARPAQRNFEGQDARVLRAVLSPNRHSDLRIVVPNGNHHVVEFQIDRNLGVALELDRECLLELVKHVIEGDQGRGRGRQLAGFDRHRSGRAQVVHARGRRDRYRPISKIEICLRRDRLALRVDTPNHNALPRALRHWRDASHPRPGRRVIPPAFGVGESNSRSTLAQSAGVIRDDCCGHVENARGARFMRPFFGMADACQSAKTHAAPLARRDARCNARNAIQTLGGTAGPEKISSRCVSGPWFIGKRRIRVRLEVDASLPAGGCAYAPNSRSRTPSPAGSSVLHPRPSARSAGSTGSTRTTWPSQRPGPRTTSENSQECIIHG